jgi:hypothetical protein
MRKAVSRVAWVALSKSAYPTVPAQIRSPPIETAAERAGAFSSARALSNHALAFAPTSVHPGECAVTDGYGPPGAGFHPNMYTKPGSKSLNANAPIVSVRSETRNSRRLPRFVNGSLPFLVCTCRNGKLPSIIERPGDGLTTIVAERSPLELAFRCGPLRVRANGIAGVWCASTKSQRRGYCHDEMKHAPTRHFGVASASSVSPRRVEIACPTISPFALAPT